MKYFSLIIVFLIFSCGNKEDILLPKSNITIVKNIVDISPVYIFFRTKGKDTLAEVNKNTAISTTNWAFNIDKRLPLRIVIPEIMKLQEKKRAGKANENKKPQNYYSYADSIGKNIAFLPFTDVYYKMEKPEINSFLIYFKKGNEMVLVNKKLIKKDEVLNYVFSLDFVIQPKILLLFDKNMSFQEYIQNKILIQNLESYNKNKEVPEEFVF
ncbi:hypothetical protein [Flavobacterium sp.]|uniref:hypothetical protein n=1 Tax=Flavobacterium sp. TaxID=239 RepID=UPI002B4AAFB4|nr:hypothetical protein [Flavobacterium sp.]HLF52268.1 hypothetical protein [Flavobacterium sp.]